MKKKIGLLLVSTTMLTACGGGPNTSSALPTSTGESSSSSSICTKHEMEFVRHVDPTAEEQGYDLYKCKYCEETKKENFTGLLGEIDKEVEYGVLFIGNSYTFYNTSWNTFAELASSNDVNVAVDNVTNGGHTLAQMADPNDTYGAKVKTKLENNGYDIVFLQEQSLRPAIQPAPFYDAVRTLNTKIIEAGSNPVLFETWGRKTGSSDLALYNMTNDTNTQKLIAAYGAIAEELNTPVSHVGAAFYKVYSQHPEIELYDTDYYHPSAAGSYLLSLVHYATVLGFSPIGVDYRYFKNDQTKQSILEQAAYDAVFGESILREEFKTSSIGVTFPNEIPEQDKKIVLPGSLPTETVDANYVINHGAYSVSEEGGKVILKNTAAQGTIMFKEELFKDGGEISFTASFDGGFTGYSAQGLVFGSNDSKTTYTEATDKYQIIGRGREGIAQLTAISSNTTIDNNILSRRPTDFQNPMPDADVEYRITIKVDFKTNIYKMYVGEDIALYSNSPYPFNGGYIGFSSGINGVMSIKDIVVNGRYLNVVIPQEITFRVVTSSIGNIKGSAYTNLVDVDPSMYTKIPAIYKQDTVKIKDIYDALNIDTSKFVNDYQVDNKVNVSTDDGQTWTALSDIPYESVKLSSLFISVSTYQCLGTASNGNNDLEGGKAAYVTPEGKIVIEASSTTRRWGSMTNKDGSTINNKDFDYVADIELKHVGDGKTTTATQIGNNYAGQRVVYCWDGSVDGNGDATVYYQLGMDGNIYPSDPAQSFKIHAENNTIKFRIHVNNYQNAKNEGTGKITWDVFPYGSDIATATNLHPQVVKNMSGFPTDGPQFVNLLPEVRSGVLTIKVVSLVQDYTK